MKRKLLVSLCISMVMTWFSVPAFAQNQTVKGKVIDDLGEPVIGATITVAGTKTATITDLDGNYTVSVPKGGKITVS